MMPGKQQEFGIPTQGRNSYMGTVTHVHRQGTRVPGQNFKKRTMSGWPSSSPDFAIARKDSHTRVPGTSGPG
eukprot:211847-Rhodomonas_salina.1